MKTFYCFLIWLLINNFLFGQPGSLDQTFLASNPCMQQSDLNSQPTPLDSYKSEAANLATASLEQNIPNPFNQTTTIIYTLPQKYTVAYIIISDKNGKILKRLNISGSGRGSIVAEASTLASGAYHYSMYADEKLIATKQMLLIR